MTEKNQNGNDSAQSKLMTVNDRKNQNGNDSAQSKLMTVNDREKSKW